MGNRRIINRSHAKNSNNKKSNYRYQQRQKPHPSMLSQQQHKNNNNEHHLNDPAIMNVIQTTNKNGNDSRFPLNHNKQNKVSIKPKYQTQHKPHKNNQFYAPHYPKPRRTVLHHDMEHVPRPRHNRKKQHNEWQKKRDRDEWKPRNKER